MMFKFVPFTVLGDPTPTKSLKVIKDYVKGGATMLELGLPFSDPVADGPVVQKADQRALKVGMNTDKAFELIEKVRKFTDVPIGLMLYANLAYVYGLERFYKKAAEVGVTSVLIPDLPPESVHCKKALKLAKRYGLQQVFIVSELTSAKRLKMIAKVSRGFIYLVSTPGVTGVRKDLSPKMKNAIQRVKKSTKLPVLVGFGVSERKHVQAIQKAGADGAIVGSRLVTLIEEGKLNDVQKLVARLVVK